MKKFLFRFVTSITLVLFFSIAQSVQCSEEISILAFGDSLTAGHQLPKTETYPARLEAMLKSAGYSATVTNGGVGGDTSAQGLRRVDWVLKNKKFDFVLLCIGANDGLRQLSLDQFENNLGRTIEKFQAHGAKVLLFGMKIPVNLGTSYREKFENIYKAQAKKYKVPLMPFLLEGVASKPQLNLPDGIHPNAEGQKVVAGNVFAFLKTYLPKL